MLSTPWSLPSCDTSATTYAPPTPRSCEMQQCVMGRRQPKCVTPDSIHDHSAASMQRCICLQALVQFESVISEMYHHVCTACIARCLSELQISEMLLAIVSNFWGVVTACRQCLNMAWTLSFGSCCNNMLTRSSLITHIHARRSPDKKLTTYSRLIVPVNRLGTLCCLARFELKLLNNLACSDAVSAMVDIETDWGAWLHAGP